VSVPTFALLGPLEVRGEDGTAVALGGRQPRLVLAALLLGEGRVVGVDVLLRAVWGEELPDTAAATLQTYVSRLRRALGPAGHELLRREVAGYRLVLQPGALDATRFRELAAQGSAALHAGEPARAVTLLRSALDLWRGEVLEDLGPDAGGAVGARWSEQRRTAEEDLLDAELRCSPAGGVVPALVDAVRTAPLRERRRGLLALALYRDGRQAEALAVLDEGRRLLADELGLDPSPALRALQARILDQDPELAAAPPPVAPVPVPVPVPVQRGAAEPASRRSLVGRRAELRVLDDVLDEVLGGAGCRHVVLEGEPGVGKTRLAQELCARAAARGATVLTAATPETGVSPAYGPWLQLLSAAAARGPVPGPAAAVLEGDPRTAGLGAAPAAVASAVADSVAESARLLAGSAGLVLLLDDLQWADPASLDLLARIGPRLSAAPVLVVTTVRHLEVSGDEAVVAALAQLSRASGTRRLTLRGLSLEESGELLARTAGGPVDEDVVAALHARSEGNPFFTTELARLFVEEGRLAADAVAAASVPTGVRDVLARRLSGCPSRRGGSWRRLRCWGARSTWSSSLPWRRHPWRTASTRWSLPSPTGSWTSRRPPPEPCASPTRWCARRSPPACRHCAGRGCTCARPRRSSRRSATPTTPRRSWPSTCGRRPPWVPEVRRPARSSAPRRWRCVARRSSPRSRCWSARPGCTAPRAPTAAWPSSGCCASSASSARPCTATRSTRSRRCCAGPASWPGPPDDPTSCST
jgi:DNA-binding SARP family transcriptional activator